MFFRIIYIFIFFYFDFFLFLVTGNSYSPEIVDENSDSIVGCIVKEAILAVDGTEQWMLIRGFDITNPVIVVLLDQG